MKKKILIIAPHADDETIGCGGTILKHKFNKEEIHYVLVTKLKNHINKINLKANKNETQLKAMEKIYKFDSINHLDFPATRLDTIEDSAMIYKLNECIKKIKPNIIYMPFPGDIHSDHRKVFNIACSCTKIFRHPYITDILLYETLSETNFSIDPTKLSFKPNLYHDITKYLKKKILICNIFKKEFKEHPFPRSIEALTSLATLRGSEARLKYAEAFMIVKKIIS